MGIFRSSSLGRKKCKMQRSRRAWRQLPTKPPAGTQAHPGRAVLTGTEGIDVAEASPRLPDQSPASRSPPSPSPPPPPSRSFQGYLRCAIQSASPTCPSTGTKHLAHPLRLLHFRSLANSALLSQFMKRKRARKPQSSRLSNQAGPTSTKPFGDSLEGILATSST